MPVIQDVDALKSWLTKKLTPICDADPAPLSKYVVALAKKDKPEEHLRKLCTDQLEVFLQTNTVKFVDDLFDALKNNTYIEQTVKQVPEATSSTVGVVKKSSPSTTPITPTEPTTSSLPRTTKRRDSEEVIDEDDRDYKRSRRTRSRSPSRDDRRRPNTPDEDRGRRRDDRRPSSRRGGERHYERWDTSKGRNRDDYRNQDQSANNQHMDSPDHLSNMPSAISVVTSLGSGSANNRPQIRGGFCGRVPNRGAH